MVTVPQTLKGFRDFLPGDARKRAWLKSKISTVFERFGFDPLETPTLEYEELLLGKYGSEADKLIYGFEDRGGRRVALRYDQTVPTARIVSQYRNQLVFPYKRYQIQNVWRADKPQKGRYREFTQCDADIIGSVSTIADAEILAVYASIYFEIGLNSLKIKINDRQQLVKSIQSAGFEASSIFSVIQTIDKLDKKSEAEVIEELLAKGFDKDVSTTLLASLKKAEIPDNLNQILSQAEALGIPKSTFEYTPALARGLDYYTGMIFEGIIPEYSGGSVGGGGRYDNLIGDLVGMSIPAVGFGLGYDRTLEAAEELNKIPDVLASSEVLVTLFPGYENQALQAAETVRKAGINTDIYSKSEDMGKQMKYADRKQISWAVIIGENEAKADQVQLKNLKTREQKQVSLDEAITIIKKK